MSLSGRHHPYSVKREILRRYLTERLRPLSRLRADVEASLHLVLVDAFSGAGLARGDAPAASVLLGVEALDTFARGLERKDRAVRTQVILREEDPAIVARILQALDEAGMGERVRRVDVLDSLDPGTIAIVDAARVSLDDIARYTAEATATTYLLDPPTPGRVPLEAVRRLAAQERTDVLLYLPATDLQKHSRYRETPVADLPPFARRVVDGYSRLLGDAAYSWVAGWRGVQVERGTEAAEAWLIERYRDRLESLDEAAVVKTCTLSLPGSGASALPLFLLTREPARALALNEVLSGAEADGLTARIGAEEAGMVREEPSGALELFGAAKHPVATEAARDPRVREVDTVGLAHRIGTHFAGRTVALREVLRFLADTGLFLPEVKRALSELRRDHRALYRSLSSDDAPIAFPRKGTAHTTSLQRRRTARTEEMNLSLPLGPADER